MARAADEMELSAGGLRLAARAWGPSDAPPTLALHGWLDNAATFDRLAPYLSGTRLVAVDLAGHGHSDHRPPGYWYHFVDYVADVGAVADALGWHQFALLGHSLGGAVATLAAAARPERVTAVYLLEALGPLSEAPCKAAQRLGHAVERTRSTTRRSAPVYSDLEEAVAARQAVGGLSATAARCLARRGTVADGDGLRWRSDPRLRDPSPQRFTEEQVHAFLGAITPPVRVIAATDGLLDPTDPRIAARLDRLGHPEVATVAGHHHVHLEDPASVAAAMGWPSRVHPANGGP